MTRTLTVRDFAQLTANLPPMLEAAAIRGLRSAGMRGVGEVVRQIDHPPGTEALAGHAIVHIAYPPVDTGAMRQSVASEPIPEGAILSVNAPQAAWMEYGTDPHMPPLGPILTWVTRKFQLGMSGGAKRKRKPKAVRMGPKPPPMHGPRKPPKHGPRMSKFQRKQQKSMRFAANQQRDAANLQRAMMIAQKVRWRIYRYGTAPRAFFSRAMKVVSTKYCPQEIRHELRALEKRL